jgi:hypothetical protein
MNKHKLHKHSTLLFSALIMQLSYSISSIPILIEKYHLYFLKQNSGTKISNSVAIITFITKVL